MRHSEHPSLDETHQTHPGPWTPTAECPVVPMNVRPTHLLMSPMELLYSRTFPGAPGPTGGGATRPRRLGHLPRAPAASSAAVGCLRRDGTGPLSCDAAHLAPSSPEDLGLAPGRGNRGLAPSVRVGGT